MTDSDRFSIKVPHQIRRFALLLVLLVIYSSILYLVYITRVLRFESLGYTFKDPNWFYMCVSVVVLAAAALTLPRRIVSVSGFVLWMLFALVVVPGSQISLYTTYLSASEGLLAGTALTASFAVAVFITWRRKPARRFRLTCPPKVFWVLIAVFSAIVYTVVALVFGLEFRFTGILNVYDIRDGYEEKLAAASGIVSYLIGTQANVVNPVVFVKGLVTRNYGLVLLGVMGQALLFSATGFKTILFSLPAILIVSVIFLSRTKHKRVSFSGTPKATVFLWGPAAMMATSVILDLLTNNIIWTSLFARRFVITPGLMTGIYVDYYSNNPLAYLAHSVLSPWVQSSYDMAPPKVIGLWVTGATETSMNAHLFADGFANFGWLGMLGAGIILGIYLRAADRAAAGLPAAVQALTFLMLAITLSNTSILTSMFTHGLVAAVVLLTFAPRTGWDYAPKKGRLHELAARQVAAIRTRRSRRPNEAIEPE